MLDKCSQNQAWYLWKKYERGDITVSMIERIFTYEACICDIFGGWFVDFHYDL